MSNTLAAQLAYSSGTQPKVFLSLQRSMLVPDCCHKRPACALKPICRDSIISNTTRDSSPAEAAILISSWRSGQPGCAWLEQLCFCFVLRLQCGLSYSLLCLATHHPLISRQQVLQLIFASLCACTSLSCLALHTQDYPTTL